MISLLFNSLSRFVIVFLLRSKCLLILWLHSLSTVILEPKKINSATVSTTSPSICHEVMGPDAMIFVFSVLSFNQLFHCPHSPSSRGSLVSSSLSAVRVVSCAYLKLLYFSQQSWFWLVRWGSSENSGRFYFLGFQDLCGQWLRPQN